MSIATVSTVYLHVVDAVVGKLREEFINEGVDDSVLNELQGVISFLFCSINDFPSFFFLLIVYHFMGSTFETSFFFLLKL